MKQRFCRKTRQWHNIDNWPVECLPEAPPGRSETIPVPYFISDTTEPIQHPIDGRFYESKRQFSKITKDAGYIEMGNDPARFKTAPKRKPDRKAITTSLQKAEARYQRGERI